jgi:hypothetical protein
MNPKLCWMIGSSQRVAEIRFEIKRYRNLEWHNKLAGDKIRNFSHLKQVQQKYSQQVAQPTTEAKERRSSTGKQMKTSLKMSWKSTAIKWNFSSISVCNSKVSNKTQQTKTKTTEYRKDRRKTRKTFTGNLFCCTFVINWMNRTVKWMRRWKIWNICWINL